MAWQGNMTAGPRLWIAPCQERTRSGSAQLLGGAALRLDQQLHGAILLVDARSRGDCEEPGLAVLAKLGLPGDG